MIKPYKPTEEAISLKQPSSYVINIADELKAHREQRRYEIAKQMLPTIFDYVMSNGAATPERLAAMADTAVACADALLERLSKGSVNPEDMATEMLE